MPLSRLQKRVIKEIVAYVRRDNLPVGFHLAELHLARTFGTAQSPVHAALVQLKRLRVVRYYRNRGFFLAVPASSLSKIAEKWSTAAEDPLYQRIADYRLSKKLPDAATESELMRIFGTSRSVLRKTLSRIQQEGWVERQVGHGWSFPPMIDSGEGLQECFAFRLVVEPAAISSPLFKPEPSELEACRKQQDYIVKEGYKVMTPMEFFEANSRFHEMIATWSGNRFFLQTIRRINQLRRLVEYRQATINRLTRKTFSQEHLAILDKIGQNDFRAAARLMREHLDGSRRTKITPGIFQS